VDNAQDFGFKPSGLDGGFAFPNVVPGSGFTVTAEYTQNGIYRTSRVTGSTPTNGTPVNDVALILMKQGAVEGKIVDGNGAAVPFAKYWLRELDFPGREFGTLGEPRIADDQGHFRIGNLFTVPIRVTAEDPVNPELLGDWNGTLQKERDVLTPTISVGSTGTGSVTIVVQNPNAGFAPVPNAEVSLFHGGGLFDFASTDAAGSVTFNGIPAGDGYTASAYSKSLAKLGSTPGFSVVRNVTTSRQIVLAFSGKVVGALHDPEHANAPVPGSNVTLFAADYQTRATTDTGGSFEFNGVREGNVTLDARDPLTIRRAVGRGIVNAANPTATVPLELEPTSTLTVKAFLPNDSGASSGILASLVEIDVRQDAPGGVYLRTSQTNGAPFAGMVRGVGFHVVIHELGGLNRVRTIDGSFGDTEAAKEVSTIFPASGAVVVHVLQGNPPVAAPNILVNADGSGVSVSGYTDASGNVRLAGLPLGTVSVQASNLSSSPLTGATSVLLSSQSMDASTSVLLGSYRGVTGYVEAEEGGASSGTRVFGVYNGITLETRTDSTGHYTFQGIVTGTSGVTVALTFLGPDDQTVGANAAVAVPNGTGNVTVPSVRLDSTPPRLLSIFPQDGSVKVAPDTTIKLTFSRDMSSGQLNSSYIHLFDVANNRELTLTLQSLRTQADKSVVATFTAPAAVFPQRFPLRSNTLYRLQISADLHDAANHRLGVDLGASFTTSDYSNPQVTTVVPSPARPLPKQGLRFAITFSKPLKTAPWSGGNGVLQLVQVTAIGGTPFGGPVAGTVELDPSTSATLFFAPNATLAPGAFYRLSITGAVDTEDRGLVDASGLSLPTWTQDFFTYDEVPPAVTIDNPVIKTSPIGASDPLYSGVLYTIPVTVTNAAADFERVDFFSVDANGSPAPINHTAPRSVDIALPQSATTFTLKAVAYDLSGNSASATRTWSVQQIPALAIASTTIAPAAVYPGRPFTETVHLAGGALDANVAVSAFLESSLTPAVTQSVAVTRPTFTAPWPDATLQLQLPPTTPATAHVRLTATASDARGTVSHDDSL
ncbi:MAG: hypothetical protein JWO56_969, partial [Acidobacteria bacterium]|nr:hypothetical protein [Acidobacteriota bacterium]